MTTTHVSLIITAAGNSSRFGRNQKKEFLPLKDNSSSEQTVLSCACTNFLLAFLELPDIHVDFFIITLPKPIAISRPEAEKALASDVLLNKYVTQSNTQIVYVEGGESRQESVYLGLKYIATTKNNPLPKLVLIHDGARPFIKPKIIQNIILHAQQKKAVIPVIPVTDTQKHIDADGKIIQHFKREGMVAAQTPQCFYFSDLYRAHTEAKNDSVSYTDDSEIWAKYVGDVFTVLGDNENIKITFQKDYDTHIIKNNDKNMLLTDNQKTIRIGFGYDLHQLVKKRRLMIGGVHIPATKGEKAHSDGDVLLHAITDAILGAAAIADIGELFPPNDTTWKNANSGVLLQKAWNIVHHKGWQLENLDCVLTLETPKLLPFREKIRNSICTLLNCETERVFIKAKTGEGLGDIGKGRAIQAWANCLLIK